MPNKNKLVIAFLSIFCSCLISAQTSDLLRLEYLNIPNSNSKNSISRFRALIQAPLKVSEGNYIVIGGEYRYIDFTFDNVPFSTDDLQSIQNIEASLGFLHRSKNTDWIYAGKVAGRISSNFETKLTSDDYIYIVTGYAIRDRTAEGKSDKPNRLILGLEYSTTPGRNYPLPIINYYREFAPKWTYTLGVPKTNIRYKFDDKNHIQAFATLDNIFANIQGNKTIDGKVAENISATLVLGGLGYEHYFTKHLLYYGYAAYSITNDYRLRDNEREDIYTIDDKNTIYFRTGIKFKY
ncbi:hypothetical protein M0G43_13260 [Subsaxibacter sp. CAU 1640]|uniref:hypothetical protein n=1 Tax=Subsaxibacter sp. CAU 1640 TaxID=2933271 RepID=UPI0020040D0E|nr:hypothetical protein [Subsaxibacter sp. CAU 1640]MCK7591549.1 hypothetical protein [Subsaxibacter sp. CAU 1640]